jgi:predicted nucleic acid-binding protein
VRAALDASVVVKWLLRADDRERDVDAALAVFDAIAMGTIEPLQPPHWLAEVAAVLARLTPDRAAATAQRLYAMEFPVFDEPELYVEACGLAHRFDHHVFDTLYHAVARCQSDTMCITADEAYYRKAHAVGGLVLLRDVDLH